MDLEDVDDMDLSEIAELQRAARVPEARKVITETAKIFEVAMNLIREIAKVYFYNTRTGSILS